MSDYGEHELSPAKRPLSRVIFSYSSAMMLCRMIAIIQGLVVIRLMAPEVLGIWLGLQLISIYGVHAHFGLLNAVNRQVPFHSGRQDPARARNIEEVARGALAIFSGVCIAMLVGIYLYGWPEGDKWRGALVLLVATVITVNVRFYMGLFRARHQFGKAGAANLLNAFVMLFGLPLVYYFGFDGLLGRAIAAASITFLGCVAIDGFHYRIKLDWSEALGLVRIGFPIMVLSYTITAFVAMDRLLIALFLDDKAMGEYALCFAAYKVLALFPLVIGQIFYPRMTETYAQSGLSRRVVKLCGQASLISAAVSGSVCVMFYVGLPVVVEMLFPKYEPGLSALRIVLIAYFLLSLSAGPNYFLIATVQKRRQFMVLLSAAGLMLLSGYFLASYGLVGIAWTVVLGVIGYVAGLWTIVARSLRRSNAAHAA
jgi:O-antigen/teichoic acid export membrane protein